MKRNTTKKKYRISEQRRCRNCGTKSYTEFLGHFKIYSYYCKKCGYTHSFFSICNSVTLAKLTQNPRNCEWLTIADVIRILESSSITQQPLSLPEFENMFKRMSGE